MSQNQIAELYGVTRQNIVMHMKNIFKEGELIENPVSKDFLHTEIVSRRLLETASDGKTYEMVFYNLDMVLAVGYRVKSKRAIGFRKWVSSVIKSYISGRSLVKHDSDTVGWNEFVSLAYKVDKIEDRLFVLEKNNGENHF